MDDEKLIALGQRERMSTNNGALIGNLTDALLSLREENARLRAALEPFSKQADTWNEIPGIISWADDIELWQPGANRRASVTIGDCRRARAALAPTQRKE